MRKTFLTAALFAAMAAGAQAQVGCRGETLSALNECIAAVTPEAPEPVEAPEALDESTVATPRPVTRTTMGGALQPRNLRAEPPRADMSAGVETPRPTVSTTRPNAAVSPFVTYYGNEGPAARASRNVLRTPRIRILDGIPGTLGTP